MTAPVVTGLILLSACAPEPDEASQTTVTSETGQAMRAAEALPDTSASEAAENAGPAEARDVKVSNDLYEFAYAYPQTAAAVPGLREQLEFDLSRTRGNLRTKAQQARAEAQKDGFPYRTYSHLVDWQVAADMPGWLSLTREWSTYSGGAHGMHGKGSLLWDKRAARALNPIDVFTSKEALGNVIREAYCDGLDRARERKRGVPVVRSDDGFNDCIEPMEQTLILGSSNGKTFDRIGIYAGPYAAGAYAEGDYEVTLPVDDAILGVVRPAYRSSFTVGR